MSTWMKELQKQAFNPSKAWPDMPWIQKSNIIMNKNSQLCRLRGISQSTLKKVLFMYFLVLDLHCLTMNFYHQFDRKVDPITINMDLLGAYLDTVDFKKYWENNEL